jgi:hypothetical protein
VEDIMPVTATNEQPEDKEFVVRFCSVTAEDVFKAEVRAGRVSGLGYRSDSEVSFGSHSTFEE